MVISETTISRKAEKVEKTPNLSGSKPKPAAAEKFPRSMIPEGTNTSGCLWWITFKPVEPSKSPAQVGVSVPSRIYDLRMIRTVDDHDLPCGLFFGQPIKHIAHAFAEYNAIRIDLTC